MVAAVRERTQTPITEWVTQPLVEEYQEDEVWNGYSLNALVNGFNPLFRRLYARFINPNFDEPTDHHKISRTYRLRFPNEAGLYFDQAIEDWGKISGEKDTQVQNFKLISSNATTTEFDLEQQALILQSGEHTVGFVSLIINGDGHGRPARYSAIYIPSIPKATLANGRVPSSEMRAAILLNAAQTAFEQDGPFNPQLRYLSSNDR